MEVGLRLGEVHIGACLQECCGGSDIERTQEDEEQADRKCDERARGELTQEGTHVTGAPCLSGEARRTHT